MYAFQGSYILSYWKKNWRRICKITDILTHLKVYSIVKPRYSTRFWQLMICPLRALVSYNLWIIFHYNGVIMSAMASQITSVSMVCSTVVQTQINENIKAPRHWPLWGEFTGDQWIPLTKGQQRGKWYHLMTSSCFCFVPRHMLWQVFPRLGVRLLLKSHSFSYIKPFTCQCKPDQYLCIGQSRQYHLQITELFMMTSSNENFFRATDPLCGEITGPSEFRTERPVTRSFGVFFDLRHKRLSKQPWSWWFETPSWSLWRQCNVPINCIDIVINIHVHIK